MADGTTDEAVPAGRRRGRLRVYLGAAPGVGKTFAMLDEGWRRAERGTDVVVGYVETHGRAKTVAQLRDLEVVPRARFPYRGQELEELDLDAVLARRPEVVLVDELAHTNAPGSRHAKRWRDVQELLDAGIDVVSTVNVQHLESLNDVVEKITGTKQRETIPDAMVRAADQIELVDMVPEALRRRMAHGNIYAADKVDAALGNYFRVGNLTALRELALLWVADGVDDSLQDYLANHGIAGTWETRERVVVAVTGSASGEALIRRAARMAARAKGDLLGVHVRPSDGLADAPPELLDAHRQLLEDLGGSYHEVVGTDVAPALTRFAEAERATQLVLGASRRSRWAELWKGSVINAVARQAGSFDLHVISYDTSADGPALPRVRRGGDALSARRRSTGWAIALLGVPLLTAVLVPFRPDVALSADLMAFLMLVVAAATIGGIGPGLFAAVAGSLALNWFLTEPIHTFTIADAENAVGLGGFLVVGGVISFLATQAARRAQAGVRAGAEAEALARVAAGLLGSDDPLPPMLDRLRSTFGLDATVVEVQDPTTGAWTEESTSGVRPPQVERRMDGAELGERARLVLYGPTLAAEDQRVLQAFVAQLRSALEQRRLREEAGAAVVTAESDALRTALLRAVSHDLRTPLASIKASVSSLLQDDVDWQPDATAEFLATIDEETDRLNDLVGNLLDMSRLETGVLQVTAYPVGWEEVVASALASISEPTGRVEVVVPESLPRILADPALLERSVANVVANALRYSPEGSPVRIEAGAVADRVDLRLIDRGPGIAPDRVEHLFQAFQRLGDASSDTGVGLGLAVARGFVEAMGGQLEAEETPGGGLTMVIRMPAAAGPEVPVEPEAAS
ncbi:sensor histidine kinase KdpD [Aquihabitans sp. G128]|uniref:sensor histidine kinase n=1 Tax=Aquihabitans sp. G128 TaxID=2849779 RepID=UPI001C2422ED|nr:sensor histidine kinase KdpD [Aquihabitans sp. G128]QXC59792.1 sensor histidine kinase KdpD [Aquihabitans sp. G128]